MQTTIQYMNIYLHDYKNLTRNLKDCVVYVCIFTFTAIKMVHDTLYINFVKRIYLYFIYVI